VPSCAQGTKQRIPFWASRLCPGMLPLASSGRKLKGRPRCAPSADRGNPSPLVTEFSRLADTGRSGHASELVATCTSTERTSDISLYRWSAAFVATGPMV
jgi:hypothetical protein